MRFILAALLLLSVSGCAIEVPIPVVQIGGPVSVKKEYPTVNLPYELRQKNWVGRQGEGSCVHATMVMALRWQRQYELANWWRQNKGDGEWDDKLAGEFNAANVRFAFTSEKGDVKFLEWACNTRRGCGVAIMGGRHMVYLVHFDDQWAGILDNNQIGKINWVPRATFVAEWLNSNSWAVTPCYTPSPPLPQK